MATIKKNVGTLYAYATNNNHGRYSCELQYDTPTRSGSVVTLPNVKVVLTRYNSGWTSNRIAGTAKIIGDTEIVLQSNYTLNPSQTESPASMTLNLGSPKITTLASSFDLYLAFASTGHSNNWNNFQGNSPLEVTVTIDCPAAKPTFTKDPYIISVQETSFTFINGEVDIDSDISYSISDSNIKTYTAVEGGISYTGLAPNTQYTVTQTAITKNTDGSANFKTTATATVTTYPYPTIVSIKTNTLTLGDTQTAVINNPLNRTVDFKMLNSSKAEVLSSQSSTGTVSLPVPLNNATAGLISSTATTAKVYYTISYGSYTSPTQEGNVQITQDLANPQWVAGTNDSNLITYQNTLSTATTVTGSPSYLVQGKSTWQYAINFGTYKANPRYGAGTSIVYEVSINGGSYSNYGTTSGKVVSMAANTTTGSFVTISVRAKDTRGFYSSIVEKSIPTTPYNKPFGSLVANRKDGYGDTVELVIYPNWSIDQAKNAGTATWSWKLSTESNWKDGGVNINTFNTVITPSTAFDNNSTWDFKVVLKDTFGTTSDVITAKVLPGVPIVFVDTTAIGLGVNTYPKEKGLAVAGMAELEKAKITKSIILGANSRIEDYDNGTKTGIFWIGG